MATLLIIILLVLIVWQQLLILIGDSRPVIRFRYIGKYLGVVKTPTRAKQGDLGFDLYISEDKEIPPLSFVDVHTNVAVQFPRGFGGRITGRSSTVRRLKLQVQEGIIDEGYTGELFIGVWNLTAEPVQLKRGDRIAQLIPMRRYDFEWLYTEHFVATDRSDSGFGSTGA